MIIVFFESLFVPFYVIAIRYIIDDTLDQLDDDHDDCMIYEDEIGDYNCARTFDICESSESEVDCVVGITREAEGEVVE